MDGKLQLEPASIRALLEWGVLAECSGAQQSALQSSGRVAGLCRGYRNNAVFLGKLAEPLPDTRSSAAASVHLLTSAAAEGASLGAGLQPVLQTVLAAHAQHVQGDVNGPFSVTDLFN